MVGKILKPAHRMQFEVSTCGFPLRSLVAFTTWLLCPSASQKLEAALATSQTG